MSTLRRLSIATQGINVLDGDLGGSAQPARTGLRYRTANHLVYVDTS